MEFCEFRETGWGFEARKTLIISQWKSLKSKTLPDGKGIMGAVILYDKALKTLQNYSGLALRQIKRDLLDSAACCELSCS